MKNIMSIILLQLLFLVDSCCVGSSQNSTYHPIDSISTNYSQSNVAYYGIRLWPKENSSGEVMKVNVENRIFLVLDMGDTLTIVSDNSLFLAHIFHLYMLYGYTGYYLVCTEHPSYKIVI